MNLIRWLNGMLIGMMSEYLFRIQFSVYPLIILIILTLYFILDLIDMYRFRKKPPEDPSETYLKFVKWAKETEGKNTGCNLQPWTRTQYEFINFLLQNKEQISKIGNLETPFTLVQKYFKS